MKDNEKVLEFWCFDSVCSLSWKIHGIRLAIPLLVFESCQLIVVSAEVERKWRRSCYVTLHICCFAPSQCLNLRARWTKRSELMRCVTGWVDFVPVCFRCFGEVFRLVLKGGTCKIPSWWFFPAISRPPWIGDFPVSDPWSLDFGKEIAPSVIIFRFTT